MMQEEIRSGYFQLFAKPRFYEELTWMMKKCSISPDPASGLAHAYTWGRIWSDFSWRLPLPIPPKIKKAIMMAKIAKQGQ